MSSFFEQISKGASNVEQEFLGPDYKYYKQIRTPQELGVSDRGSLGAMADDVAGLINYVELLVSGGGRASIPGGPLGNRFFLKTGGQCTDVATKKSVDRYLYVNNVPDGQIPLISSGLGVTFTEFEGLLPGILEDIGRLDPLPLFSSFMQGAEPPCMEVTLPTVSTTNQAGSEAHHVPTAEISDMNACWFSSKKNPVTGEACRETFVSANEQLQRMAKTGGRRENKVKIDFKKNKFAHLYALGFGALILYVIYRLGYRKRN
jgi:hypothetical protein